ncbi:MAG TPA: phosphocholine cytidylyltransferase family protein [Candidatus Binatia bacterium]|nr:phosphocholine cytidylyltransferase family protein [Candidatus Binatia bacterium]
MKAIILSAGQGSRLLPLTADRPKCLLSLAGRPLIEWQVRHLAASGVREVVVVVGFRAEAVEAALASLDGHGLQIRTIFNPFYKVAENVASCWMARHEMDRDFMLLNGDVVFEPAVARTAISRARGAITVTINRPSEYDEDDMKVELDGERVLAIGKDLPMNRVGAESIGMMIFRKDGPRLFAEELDHVMRTPEGTRSWFTQVIHRMAARGVVGSVAINELDWGEIDFHDDLEAMRAMVERWVRAEREVARA